MERALTQNSEILALSDDEVVKTDNAQDLVFIAVGATAFKLQGSSDDGSTYGDIEESAMSGDGTNAERLALSVFRCHFDHVKVVMTGANAVCVVMRHGLRQCPHPSVLAGGIYEDFTEHIIDPQLGTA